MAQDIPVFLFLGFLEAGKTTFIQGTMEDPRFDTGESTLLLVLEEGEEEYDPKKFALKRSAMEILSAEDLSESALTQAVRTHRAERVILEYNGMLLLDRFLEVIPENWQIAQIMTFFDANTFLTYNANMRQLVYDKIQYADMVVFNRMREGISKEELHKIVRAVSRRPDIVYEYEGGKAEYDDIDDPLPYDLNAPVVEIADRDFAYFYRDLHEETAKYEGKVVKLKGMVALDRKMKAGTIGVGRYIMTCCAADIAFNGLICDNVGGPFLKTKDWIVLTARIAIEYNKLYGGEGPVLKIISYTRTEPLTGEDEVATFY